MDPSLQEAREKNVAQYSQAQQAQQQEEEQRYTNDDIINIEQKKNKERLF